MEFLKILETLRTPFLDAVMSAVTLLGDELFYTAAALALFWCVSKREGYFLFTVGSLGAAWSQIMKLACRVPRPWVLDPDFTIVESAREGAGGYSFPSGHAQSAVGTMGSLAAFSRRRSVRAGWWVLSLLVCFSRMYLGVHTPRDVIVGALLSLILLALLYPSFREEETFRRRMPFLLLLLFASALAFLAFTLWFPFPEGTDPENLAHGMKNAGTLCGCLAGLGVSWLADRKRDFRVEAPLPGQLLKLGTGLGLLAGLRALLKAPLRELFGSVPAADGVRYFLVVLFAGCVWPLTFPFFSRIGAKRGPSE